MRGYGNAMRCLKRDAARHVATKTLCADMTMRESPQGMEASIGCAAGDGMGGGIFAKTAKTPPLQSGVCGDFIAIRIAPKGRPLPPPCAYHAIPHAPMSPWFYNDVAPKSRPGAPRRYKRRRPPSSPSRPGVDVHPQAAVAHPDDGRFPSPLGRQVGQPPRHREKRDWRGCRL